MIAQALLTLLLGAIILYAWISYRRTPALGLLTLMAALAALYFVWIPAHATALAAAVGIGRGVDLIIYLWMAISLIVALNLHLRLRAQTEVMTALARSIAIAQAQDAKPDAPASDQIPAPKATPRPPQSDRSE